MDQTSINQRISELLNRLLALQESEGKVNAIDIALMKKYSVELYEQLITLESGVSATWEMPEVKIPEPAPAPVAIVQAPKEKKVVAPEPEIPEEVEELENVLKVPEPVIEPKPLEKEIKEAEMIESVVPEPSQEENQLRIPLKDEKKEEKKPQNPAAPPAVKAPSIREKASSEPGTKIYEKFNQAKIESIQKNISLMKRFEFQKVLFKDNPDYYKDAIRFFDDAGSAADALAEFEELGSHFEWDMESTLVLELKELIARRHM